MSDAGLSAEAARSELYGIMAADLPFPEKATRAMEVGERYLGVDNAHLTRVDPENNYWKAIASTDPDDGAFPAGLVIDFDTSYCRRTVETGVSLALHDAPAQGWADDPAFEAHGLHCYHGTALVVDNEPTGRSASSPRTPGQSRLRRLRRRSRS
ncbi:GAF domain-containing protein [Halobellus rufus]|uniref:GAF domain-containing protein n=1 Tax=Halobellus rufus TaxID=1448860 RepID=UPI00067993D5|nr:hypothetical protein [Halobellus rufus]